MPLDTKGSGDVRKKSDFKEIRNKQDRQCACHITGARSGNHCRLGDRINIKYESVCVFVRVCVLAFVIRHEIRIFSSPHYIDNCSVVLITEIHTDH